MQHPKKEESSLLISLRELRGIEENRILEEEEGRRLQAAEAQRAREAEAQRLRDAEAQRVRDAEEAGRRRADDEARRRREEELRLEESERKARVDAQLRLEQERLKLEVEANAIHGAKRKPKGLIAVAALLTMAVVGLGGYAYTVYQRNVEQAAETRAADAARRAAEAKLALALDGRKAAEDALANAKTAEEKRRAQELLDQKNQEIEDLGGTTAPAPAPAPAPRPTPRPPVTPKPDPRPAPVMICPENMPMCSDAQRIPAGPRK